MKKTFSIFLKISGTFSFLISLILAFFTLGAYSERDTHGSGLMFADAELLLILMIIFLLIGIVCFWFVKKLKS
jgi:hypothetical protein